MVYIHKKTFDIVHHNLYHLDNVNEHNYAEVEKDYFIVDELISLPIQALNRKGYITLGCCAGHKYDYHCYQTWIHFKERISLPPLPLGWYIDDKFGYKKTDLAIRRKFDETLGTFKYLHDVLESMEQLYEWALKLPEFK